MMITIMDVSRCLDFSRLACSPTLSPGREWD